MRDLLFQRINHKKVVELRVFAYTWLTLVFDIVIIIWIGNFSVLLATIGLLGSAIFIHSIHFNRADFITSLLSACITPFFDVTAHIFDLWQFSEQNLFGVPYWLPFMYLVSSLLILRLKELITD